jgi:lysozyme
MARSVNKAGLNLIKDFEGLRLSPYLCSAGVPTIGYGSTYYENGSKVSLKDKQITEERAEELLAFHLKEHEHHVDSCVKVNISNNQFSALVAFCYNVGPGSLKKSTLLKLLNQNDIPGAAEQFLRWNKAGGKELAGLTRRRQAERSLFLKEEIEKSDSSEEEINQKLSDIEKDLI